MRWRDDGQAALEVACGPEDVGARSLKLERLLSALDDAAIVWCRLRAEGPGPDGDVDLLVADTELDAARDILSRHGFVGLRAWGRGSHRFFLTYDPAVDRWIKLDVVTRLEFGRLQELVLGAERGCLSRRVQSVTPMLSPDDSFWTLLLHCVLDKRAMAPHHGTRLRDLAASARTDGELGSLVATLCPEGWDPARILSRATAGRWDELLAIGPELHHAWARREPLRTRARALRNRLGRVLTRALLLRTRGVSVALIAPDGAGKSTLADALRESLPFPVRRVYMGRGTSGEFGGHTLLPRLVRQWHRYLAAQVHLARGRIVIFDRYTYDALLPSPRRPTWFRRARRWLLAHAIPPPELAVLLDVPGEVMFRRKGEHSPEVLERRRAAYRELAARIERIKTVDASGSRDEVRRRLNALVCSTLVRRERRLS